MLGPDIDVIEKYLILHFRYFNTDRDGVHFHTFGFSRHYKQSEAIGAALDVCVGCGACHHQHIVGLGSIGNEVLCAVNFKTAVVRRFCDGVRFDGVSAGVRFGDGKAKTRFTATGIG